MATRAPVEIKRERRMVPSSFGNYFVAMASAGGALIGLLFVAVSIRPERIFGSGAQAQQQAVAANAFSALVNAFFISAAGLIPDHGVIGPTTLVMAIMGILSAVSLAARTVRAEWRRGRHWLTFGRILFMIGVSLAIYAIEINNAVTLIRNPRDTDAVYTLAALVLAVYGIGLIRAWELLGAPRSGVSGWLNPLRDLEDDEERAEADAGRAAAQTSTARSTHARSRSTH
jgi:hypothetical protein